jgi:BirA family biotin operon repressor/biotin-[acetyl-CoA-carboxylase] ligase
VWEAPRGSSILCSVLLRPPRSPEVAQLSLVGGLAVAEAVGRGARIKWPNDVLVEGGKVAGVLAEAFEGVVVLGIGVNVNQEPGELPEGATSLKTVDGAAHDRALLLARLLERLAHNYGLWLEHGLDALHDELVACDFLRGRRLRVDGAEATALGIARSGALEVDLGGERREIVSGEVAYEP